MGVTGLWKLIEPCGTPVPVETLEGKILAVDISIWLHQVVKGFQDNSGSALANAHLLGLFHRLCKLLYYRVKPVFVFDGCVPQLKRDTIAKRQQQRGKLNTEADRIQAILLQSLAKEKVVQQALGANAIEKLTSDKSLKAIKARTGKDADDLFKLPDLPDSNSNAQNDSNDSSYLTDECNNTTASDDSSFDESNLRYAHNANLQAIDVKSHHFRDLPADVRHEILVDIKETRKQSSWGRLHELPSRIDDFSTFQMKRLLKRRAVQESLEEAEQEMGGRTLTYMELTNLFTEEGIVEPSVMEKGSKQISSDEHTRFLLVRDLKKKLSKVHEIFEKTEVKNAEKEKIQDITEADELNNADGEILKIEATSKTPNNYDVNVHKDEKPSTSKHIKETKSTKGKEYEADLEMAIARSLDDSKTEKVYSKEDYEFDSGATLKLNKMQRTHLQNAVKGPARSYMIEYGGMNEDEVVGIMEQTQLDNTEFAYSDDNTNEDLKRAIAESLITFEKEKGKNTLNKSEESLGLPEDIAFCIGDSDDDNSDMKSVKDKINYIRAKSSDSENNSIRLNVSDTDTDSDLEEVQDEGTIDAEKSALKIVINKNEILKPEDDLFADVFNESIRTKETTMRDDALKEQGFKENNETNLVSILEELKKQASEINKIKLDNIKIENSQPISISDDNDDCDNISNDKNIKNIKSTETNTRDDSLKEQSLKENGQSNLELILEELKKQASEINKLKLDNIKIENSQPISISDDNDDCDNISNDKNVNSVIRDKLKEDKKVKSSEVLEILDEGNSENGEKSQSKFKTLHDYYETNYLIKRTPPKSTEKENIPKIKSPFFVRKTPTSSSSEEKTPSNKSNKQNTSPLPIKRKSRASKCLFEEQTTKEEDNKPLPPKQARIDPNELIGEAAELLKAKKSTDELESIAENLAKKRQELENERNRQDRMGMTISQRMNIDCQELLRLFGIPYIVAPMEAEAQCAFLDAIELTNGTITDDSDIWLFGGRTVYKNFFAQNKHVLEFRSKEIEKSFNCDRKKLIQLACLVGSDYTPGIHGIGAVTALEILASFPSTAQLKERPEKEQSINTTISGIILSLSKFRDWWHSSKSKSMPSGSSTRQALLKKLKNIELHEGFPNCTVVEAYLTPKVDDCRETFTWGYPDVVSIREFARKTFGWTTAKTDNILMPIIKKLDEKKTQSTIRNYFSLKSAISTRDLKVSKRVQNAIDKMSGKQCDTPEKPNKKPRGKRKKITESSAEATDTNDVESKNKEIAKETGNNNDDNEIPKKQLRRTPRIPNSKEVIPQREETLKKLQQNKEKATQILRNTKADGVYKTRRSK